MFALRPSYFVGNTQFYLQFISSSAMTSSKLPSITSFFAAQPSIIPKKRKAQVIDIDADERPDEAVIVATNVAIETDSRLVDVVFVVDGVGAFLSFLVVANPKAKAGPVRGMSRPRPQSVSATSAPSGRRLPLKQTLHLLRGRARRPRKPSIEIMLIDHF